MAKTIVITGASTGIGRATALYFADRGWNVAATMRTPGQADASLDRPDIFIPDLDVTDEASIASAVAAIQDRFGKIDVLLNNAGYGLLGAFEAMTPEQLDRQLRTNLYGLIRVTQQVLPGMRDQGHGLIVNVSSIGGRVAFPYAALYCATKFAVEGLSEALRYELAGHNIRVKVIEPGGTNTDYGSRSLVVATNDIYRVAVDKAMAAMAKMSKSLPAPETVARAIYRAATDNRQKLRYPVNAGPILFLRAILPDHAVRLLLSRMF